MKLIVLNIFLSLLEFYLSYFLFVPFIMHC